MATYTKFQSFVEHLAEGVHNLETGVLTIALTASANAPVNTYSRLSQLTQISYTNCSTRTVTVSSSSQSAGTYALVLTDKVLTASGSVGPFRYVVLYNDTATNDELIAYWDYGSEVTLANGETFTIDFAANALTIA